MLRLPGGGGKKLRRRDRPQPGPCRRLSPWVSFAVMSSLDPAQIDRFKRQGFLVLEGLVEPGRSPPARPVLVTVGADREDPATGRTTTSSRTSASTRPWTAARMQTIVEQIGGGMFEGGGGSMLVKWPGPEDAAWKMPDSGPLDGYGPAGWSGGFMLGATAYMDDVEPGAAASSTGPAATGRCRPTSGSTRSRSTAPSRTGTTGLRGSGVVLRRVTRPARRVHRPGGRRHPLALLPLSQGSANVRTCPRLGVFARWHRTDREEMKYACPRTCGRYWAI